MNALIEKNAGPVIAEWDGFMREARRGGLLKELDRRFYSYVPIFDYVDLRAFKRRIKKRLPTYWPMFLAAGQQYDIPPSFLAAQGYQESHWNPRAKSPTGVRGIMMLTLATAKRVGIDNRLDARQSIHGGAKYFAELLGRLPEDIREDDKLWFGLAAYNLGMGHLYDARALADRLGRDKNRWSDMESVLPLLAHKEHYSGLRYGYARGHEAVRYVKRIRNYWDVLVQSLN